MATITHIDGIRAGKINHERQYRASALVRRRVREHTNDRSVVAAAEATARAAIRQGESVHRAVRAGQQDAERILETGQRGPVATNANVIPMPRRHRQYIGVTPGGGDAA